MGEVTAITTSPAFTNDYGSLHQEDCLTVLPSVADESVDLVFADPPFNLKKDYGPGVGDDLSDDAYLAWCADWITECCRVLAPGGSFFLYNLPKWNIHLGQMLTDEGLDFRHWIAVDMKMSLPIRGRLYPSHYSLLYYSKGKPRTFDGPRTPIQTCRHCGGDIKDYGGHHKKMNPLGVNVSDVWTDIPPVRHRKTKNRGPNELSEKMLERVIAMSSAEGDLVLDPFGGSGTTYAVAQRMHRNWIGMELGDVEPIIARLEGRDFHVEPPGRGDAGKGLGNGSLDARDD